jgi:hypothetical protein
MAIGATRVHGGVGIEGQINGETGTQLGQSLAFFHIQPRGVGLTPTDLRPEMAANPDGGLGLAVEKILQTMPSGVLAYSVANTANSNIYVITDGVNVPSQTVIGNAIRALGTSVGTNGVDLSGSLVTTGTTFTVA